jgi:hypothetical protein
MLVKKDILKTLANIKNYLNLPLLIINLNKNKENK